MCSLHKSRSHRFLIKTSTKPWSLAESGRKTDHHLGFTKAATSWSALTAGVPAILCQCRLRALFGFPGLNCPSSTSQSPGFHRLQCSSFSADVFRYVCCNFMQLPMEYSFSFVAHRRTRHRDFGSVFMNYTWRSGLPDFKRPYLPSPVTLMKYTQNEVQSIDII